MSFVTPSSSKRPRSDSLSSDEEDKLLKNVPAVPLKRSKMDMLEQEELQKEMPKGILSIRPEEFIRGMVEARGYEWDFIPFSNDLHKRYITNATSYHY